MTPLCVDVSSQVRPPANRFSFAFCVTCTRMLQSKYPSPSLYSSPYRFTEEPTCLCACCVCVCVSLSSSVVLRTSRVQRLLLMLTPALARTPHAALLSLLCLLPILRRRLRKPFRSLSPCLHVGRRVRMPTRGCGPSPLPFGSALALCDVRVWCCLVLMGFLYLGVFPPPLSIDAVRCSPCCSAPLVVVVVVGGLCVECARVRAYDGRARGIPFGSLPCALEKTNS